MRIGQLSEATGVSRDTLRFYEAQGLIRAQRRENGYREYPQEAVVLVNYIRTAQRLGFTLAEVSHKMADVWTAQDPNQAIAEVLAEKLQEIDARIESLRELRNQLAVRVTMECPMAQAAWRGREGG